MSLPNALRNADSIAVMQQAIDQQVYERTKRLTAERDEALRKYAEAQRQQQTKPPSPWPPAYETTGSSNHQLEGEKASGWFAKKVLLLCSN